MGATLAGLLILTLFLASSLIMSRSTLHGNTLVGMSTKLAIRLSGERARTAIDITSTSGDGACNLTINVDNTGTVSVKELSLMDVVVQFPGGNNPPERLEYAGSTPPNLGQWSATSVSGPFEPGIFNPGETMTIDAQLLLIEADDGTVTVGTPNGIVDTAVFPVLTPCP